MKNIKIIFLICMALSSCKYNEKIASRQVARAAGTYPTIMAGYCAAMYPIKESVIDSTERRPGKINEQPPQIIYVNCDSAKASGADTKQVGAKCPPCNCPDPDTIYKYRTITKENTAALNQAQGLLEEKTIALQDQKTKNDDLADENSTLWWWIIGLSGYIVLKMLLRMLVPAAAPFIKYLP